MPLLYTGVFETILRTIVTDIGKVWFSLNVHVLLMSMVITGSIRKIGGWIKLRGSHIVWMKFCLFCFSGHFSLVVAISFCFVCSTLFFVLKLAAEVFVIHHLPLISWTNTCFAFQVGIMPSITAFKYTCQPTFKCYLHYGLYFPSLIIESKQGLVRNLCCVTNNLLFLHNIPYTISAIYFLSDKKLNWSGKFILKIFRALLKLNEIGNTVGHHKYLHNALYTTKYRWSSDPPFLERGDLCAFIAREIYSLDDY